jgi:hypothetical protein
MEVQVHGNLFEDRIIFQHTGLTKKQYQKLPGITYTSPFDIVKNVKSQANISVKAVKKGKTIWCGDILRFVNHCYNKDFTIVAGCWNQINSNYKEFYEILEFFITPNLRHIICGNLNIENLKPFVDYVKSIPEGKSSQLKNRSVWKEKRQELYNLYSPNLLKIDAKIDSKNQRRVQCSLQIDEMIKAQIPYNKYHKEYKGIVLPYEEKSPPRSFKKS